MILNIHLLTFDYFGRIILAQRHHQGVSQMNRYNVEYTDTFGGEANYSWVRRATITMPELTHYGYDGATNYTRASRAYDRELMRRAKATIGLTGVRGESCNVGDTREFRPYGSCTVLFVSFDDSGA